jgi:hypothetical protein
MVQGHEPAPFEVLGTQPGADPGIPLRVGGFCILISNFNIYNTKKGQKPKYIVHINKK